MSSRLVLMVAAAALSVVLAGCAAPVPGSTPSPAAESPTPTSTPVPTVESITVRADAFSATDTAGDVVESFTYFTPITNVIGGLTDIFGFEPTVSVVERRPNDGFAGTVYDWQGFAVLWDGFEDEPGTGAGTAPFNPGVHLRVMTAAVGSITIRTADGLRVGDDGSGVEGFADAYRYTDPNDGTTTLALDVDVVPLPAEGENSAGDYTFAVSLQMADAGPIVAIRAPSPNFGA